jgi:outer membrane protein assembly factor BamB
MFRVLKQALIACLLVACSAPQSVNCTPGSSSGTFPLKVRWCVKIDRPIDQPPKTSEGVIYVHAFDPNAAEYYAIDTETSKILWTYATDVTEGLEPFRWDIVKDYMILTGGLRKEGLDRLTGRPLWQRSDNSTLALTTDGEKIFLASGGSAQAIDPANGETIWEYTGLPSHRTFGIFYDSTNARVIIPADRLHVLDAESGRLLYLNDIHFPAGDREAIPYQGQLVYGAYIIDEVSGGVTYRINDGVNTNQPLLISSNTLYHLTTSGGLASFDLKTQSQNWVYFPMGTDSTIHRFLSNLAILNGYGYILADDDTLRAISLATGKEIGQWSGPSTSYSMAPPEQLVFIPSPGVVSSDNSLYVSLGTNLLYAFEAP